MKSSKIIQIAWTGLSRNKLRSLLTMLGVIIGVAAVIVMISVSAGTEASIEEQINSLGTNLIFVRSSFARGGFGPGGPGEGGPTGGLTFDDAAAIAENVSDVEAVVVEQPSSETVKAGNVTVESVSVLGTTPDFPSVRDMVVANGRYFSETEVDRTKKVAVLGASLAEELFGEATAVGQVVTVGDVKLTVVGVFKERGLVGETDYDARIYIPITVVFDKFTPSFFARVRGDSVQLIYVETTADADTNQDDVILQIQLLLTKRHDVTLDEPDFTVTTQQDLIDTQESTTAAFRSLLAWVAAVSLIVGGIGIMNIMLVSVTERTREIGIRQSIGATPNDIRWQFLTEAMLLSLAGGVLGVLVGIGGAYLYGAYGELRTVVLPSSLILAFTSAAAVGIFFGFYPANQAARLDPIEALRHE
jgi:putative ABC transport system permease protein